MKKVVDNLICITVIGLTLLGFVLFVCLPKKEFSENENRYLEVWPTFSFSSLKDGSFISSIETYINDHFPLRDNFISLYANVEKSIGKTEINSIYLGVDDSLIVPFTKETDEDKIVSSLNKLDLDDVSVDLMLVPNKIAIYKDSLGINHEDLDELEEIEDIYDKVSLNTISLEDVFLEYKDDYELFYKTDHHWTYYGAYLAYATYMNKDIQDIENKVLLSDDFLGTSHSKLNIKIDKDSIYTIDDDTKYEVNYVYEDVISDSLYNYDYLDKKDKYSVFLDNNHALIEVTNLDSTSEEEILIIKNSYGNSFVPLIARDYKKVAIIDLRYYNKSVLEYIESNNIKKVLVLYDIQGIYNDSSILKIK